MVFVSRALARALVASLFLLLAFLAVASQVPTVRADVTADAGTTEPVLKVHHATGDGQVIIDETPETVDLNLDEEDDDDAVDDIQPDATEKIDKKGLDALIASEKSFMLAFVAPWCHHCKALKPEYEKAAKQLNPRVTLAMLDCTEFGDVCQNEGVKGYPTIKFFKDGKAGKPYGGPRTTEGIVDYIEKRLSPAIRTIKSEEELTGVKAVPVNSVIGYFASRDTQIYRYFKEAADEFFDDLVFAEYIDDKYKKPKVVFHKPQDQEEHVFRVTKTTDDTSLAKFINAYKTNLLDFIDGSNYQMYLALGKPVGYIFIATDEQAETIRDGILPWIKEHRDRVALVLLDARLYPMQATAVGLTTEGGWPQFGIQDVPNANGKYPILNLPSEEVKSKEGEKEETTKVTSLTAKEIIVHLDDFLAGKLEPYVRSEEIPKTQDNPVHKVVGKSFESDVLHNKKSVFLSITAPWCGHCKSMKGDFEKLAEEFAGDKEVVIANIDATENDLPAGHEVQSFPTLRLYKPHAGDGYISYGESGRSFDELKKFVNVQL